MSEKTRLGRVVTFYSYQAGAGRTMALANVAALLRKWGQRVLVIDWDLEAPGLENYFEPEPRDGRKPLAAARRRTPGLADIIAGFARERPLSWRDCLIRAPVFPHCGPVALLSAGQDDGGYAEKVRSIDWERLFRERDLATYLEGLRAQWIRDFDFVLIDSPIGTTDIGGSCTARLPDLLVVLLLANEHSLGGATRVIRQAREAHARLAHERTRLQVVPVLARDESVTEHEKSFQFRERVAEAIGDYCRPWLPPQVSVVDALQRLKLPHTSYWSFGERLPVVLEGTSDPASLGYAYQALARLIEHDLEWESATDVEQRVASAEERSREAQASLQRIRLKIRRIGSVLCGVAAMALALGLGMRQCSAREARRERVDTLIEALRGEDDPVEAAVLWRELAESDPPRALADALGAERALAWPLRAFRVASPMSALALGPRGSSLAWSSGDGVLLRRFAPKDGLEIVSKQPAGYTDLHFSKDGRLLLATHADAAPSLWNLDASTSVTLPQLPAQTAFSRDGTGLIGIASDFSSAMIWRLHDDPPEQAPRRVPIPALPEVRRPTLRAMGADGMSFLGEGSSGGRHVLLVSTALDDSLQKTSTRAVDPDCAVQSAAVSGSALAYQCALTEKLLLRSASKRGARSEIRAPGSNAGDVKSSSFSSDGAVLMSTWSEGVTTVCEVRGTRCATLREREPIVRAELAPDGLSAVTLTSTGVLRIWGLGFGVQAPRDWGSLRAVFGNVGEECLAPARRAVWLREQPAQARAGYERCERRHGRTPLAGDAAKVLSLPSLLPSGLDTGEPAQPHPANEAPAGLVRVSTSLNVDSEDGHLLFPLSVTGVASTLEQGFGVVAGVGDVVAFHNVGSFLQQAQVATSLVSSTGSQRVATSSQLSSGQKTPLPWLVVDSQRDAQRDSQRDAARGSQRSRSGQQQWQAARPFLQLTRDFRWDATTGHHVAELAFGLDAETGPPGPLAEPIPVRFASRCKVSPIGMTLKESGPASTLSLSIACSRNVKNERPRQTLGIRVSNGALDYPFAIPRRQGPFELVSSARSVLGLGLGTLEMTVVHAEEDRTPLPVAAALEVPFDVDVEGGKLKPVTVKIASGQSAVTTSVRPRGLGVMQVSAGRSGLESRPLSIRRSSPLLFMAVTLLGGGLGGYASVRRPLARRRRSLFGWRAVGGRVLEGAAIGMASIGAMLVLFSSPAALHQSELAWFLGSVLVGFAGPELVEILRRSWIRRRAARADHPTMPAVG